MRVLFSDHFSIGTVHADVLSDYNF